MVFIVHLIIDTIKAYPRPNIWTFIFDQLLHFISLYLVFLYIINDFSLKPLLNFVFKDRNLTILFSVLLVTLPVGIFISKVLDSFNKDLNLESLAYSGLVIGIVERLLTFELVMLNQYEAIGFLIASKSFWFGSKSEFGKKERDYILVGNLLSFSTAIIVGIITKMVLE